MISHSFDLKFITLLTFSWKACLTDCTGLIGYWPHYSFTYIALLKVNSTYINNLTTTLFNSLYQTLPVKTCSWSWFWKLDNAMLVQIKTLHNAKDVKKPSRGYISLIARPRQWGLQNHNFLTDINKGNHQHIQQMIKHTLIHLWLFVTRKKCSGFIRGKIWGKNRKAISN